MPHFDDSGTQDFLTRSAVLRKHGSKRAFFDATDPEHCASLRQFIKTGNWGEVQFFPEFPFTDVPMTVLMKFAGHHLKTERVTPTLQVNPVIPVIPGMEAAGREALEKLSLIVSGAK